MPAQNPAMGSLIKTPTIHDLVNTKKGFLELEQLKRDEEDRMAFDEAYKFAQGDIVKTRLNLQRQGRFNSVARIDAYLAEQRKASSALAKEQLANLETQTKAIAQIANSVTDPVSHKLAYERLMQDFGPAAANELGAVWIDDDETVEGEQGTLARVKLMASAGTTMVEQNRIAAKALEMLAEAGSNALKEAQAIAALFALSEDQEDWDAWRDLLINKHRVDPRAMEFVPQLWSPEAVEKMKAATISAKDEAAADLAERKFEHDKHTDEQLANYRNASLAIQRLAQNPPGAPAGVPETRYRMALNSWTDRMEDLSARIPGEWHPLHEEWITPALSASDVEMEINRIWQSYWIDMGVSPPPGARPPVSVTSVTVGTNPETGEAETAPRIQFTDPSFGGTRSPGAETPPGEEPGEAVAFGDPVRPPVPGQRRRLFGTEIGDARGAPGAPGAPPPTAAPPPAAAPAAPPPAAAPAPPVRARGAGPGAGGGAVAPPPPPAQPPPPTAPQLPAGVAEALSDAGPGEYVVGDSFWKKDEEGRILPHTPPPAPANVIAALKDAVPGEHVLEDENGPDQVWIKGRDGGLMRVK